MRNNSSYTPAQTQSGGGGGSSGITTEQARDAGMIMTGLITAHAIDGLKDLKAVEYGNHTRTKQVLSDEHEDGESKASALRDSLEDGLEEHQKALTRLYKPKGPSDQLALVNCRSKQAAGAATIEAAYHGLETAWDGADGYSPLNGPGCSFSDSEVKVQPKSGFVNELQFHPDLSEENKAKVFLALKGALGDVKAKEEARPTLVDKKKKAEDDLRAFEENVKREPAVAMPKKEKEKKKNENAEKARRMREEIANTENELTQLDKALDEKKKKIQDATSKVGDVKGDKDADEFAQSM